MTKKEDIELGIKYHFDNPILFTLLIISIGIQGYFIGKFNFKEESVIIGFFGWFMLSMIILGIGSVE